MAPGKLYKKSISIQGDKSGSSPNVVETSINSPLQRFVRAKRRINQVYDEIYSYLKESRAYLIDCEISEQSDNETRKDIRKVDAFLGQVVSINEVLRRDHMKVAFFGRTSNGKSTVVNAMLSDRILPAGIGHTTNCFVTVLGADGQDAYMEDATNTAGQRNSVESLQQLAHALHNNKLDHSSLLKVYWPKSKCPLLKDDVVFVDSPGIDVTPDLDSWIDKHCLDADVFVLVVNSESTINQTEKSFFHKVTARLSKPNVFILNNRWDASADGDPDMIKLVKQQHLERTTEFLVDELKCSTKNEAEDRIFFVSALEMLRHRISEKKRSKNIQRQMSIGEEEMEEEFRMGKVARRQEFEDFELKFKECISKTAISTKFYSHTTTGVSIAKEMILIMDQIIARASSQRAEYRAGREEQQEALDYMTSKLQEVTSLIHKKITSISEEVELHVSKAMSEEIRRLGVLVGEFDYPFHPHAGFLKNYKQELHTHIERGLGKNLKARCSAPLLESIDEYKCEMQEEIFSFIPASACSSFVSKATPRTNFAVNYELDVPNLCSDFQEDITFRFSLGWTNLIAKFVAPRNPRLALLLGAPIKRSMIYFPPPQQLKAVPSQRLPNDLDTEKRRGSRDEMAAMIGRNDEDGLTLAVIQGLSSLGSTTAVSMVVTASLIWRAVGWKVITFGLSSYLTIYLYERAMWTNAAKEKCFKKQFGEYASEKLQLVVSFTSKGTSHQIERELSSTFDQLSAQVDSAKNKITNRIQELDEEIKLLEDVETKAKLFRNKATWLENELNAFMKEFGLLPSKL